MCRTCIGLPDVAHQDPEPAEDPYLGRRGDVDAVNPGPAIGHHHKPPLERHHLPASPFSSRSDQAHTGRRVWDRGLLGRIERTV
jgi:hypothetical protein